MTNLHNKQLNNSSKESLSHKDYYNDQWKHFHDYPTINNFNKRKRFPHHKKSKSSRKKNKELKLNMKKLSIMDKYYIN